MDMNIMERFHDYCSYTFNFTNFLTERSFSLFLQLHVRLQLEFQLVTTVPRHQIPFLARCTFAYQGW